MTGIVNFLTFEVGFFLPGFLYDQRLNRTKSLTQASLDIQEEHMKTEHDYIVVGGGSGGCAMATARQKTGAVY